MKQVHSTLCYQVFLAGSGFRIGIRGILPSSSDRKGMQRNKKNAEELQPATVKKKKWKTTTAMHTVVLARRRR